MFQKIMFSAFHYFAMRIVLKKQENTARIYDEKMIILISIVLLSTIIGLTFMYQNNIVRWCTLCAMIVLAVINRKRILGFLREIEG